MTWPDVVIAFVVLIGALRGFKRGLVRELAGAIALVFAIVAALRYPGIWDAFMRERFHLGFAAAHVVGMLAYAVAAYLIVLALGAALSMAAKLPLLGVGNAVFGALVGGAKALVVVWALLYVVLFLPLAPAVRADLRRSQLVAVLQQPTRRLDASLRSSLPSFLQPVADSLFAQHDR
ncbi:MAG: CvpA family protein [Candidatus Eremiobacteraeota bacterium]|nr:CvpA family protein [Candidatus Eremiobacteraeota bacterium]